MVGGRIDYEKCPGVDPAVAERAHSAGGARLRAQPAGNVVLVLGFESAEGESSLTRSARLKRRPRPTRTALSLPWWLYTRTVRADTPKISARSAVVRSCSP